MSIYESSIYKSFEKGWGMTVEELASYILISKHHASICGIETAELLRQQAKEIEQLKTRNKQLLETQEYLFKQHDSDKSEIETLKYELSSGAWRELTDEEILDIWINCDTDNETDEITEKDYILFARALLKEVRG